MVTTKLGRGHFRPTSRHVRLHISSMIEIYSLPKT